MWTLEFARPNTDSAISALLHVMRRVLVVFERQTVLFMPCFCPQRPLNAQNRHADSIGIYSVFVTLGAEYIGGRSRRLQIHDFCKCRNPRYLRCFLCLQYRNPRYLRCFLYIHCPKPNDVHGLVSLRTEHPCPEPNDVHGLNRFATRASMSKP